MDPVLEQFGVMQGGGAGVPDDGGFPMPVFDDEFVSRQVPILLAGALVGSVTALFIFKMVGFRFVFGANVGS